MFFIRDKVGIQIYNLIVLFFILEKEKEGQKET